ncbi:hypothetical protein [Bosea sp. Root381]|nr:hypothetical protein [Bosea sp. Root381]
MLERHDSDYVLETEREDEIETTEQDSSEGFSPRAHQEGFWS